MGTLITGLILLGIVAAVIRKIYRDNKKNGCTGCCCDCARRSGCTSMDKNNSIEKAKLCVEGMTCGHCEIAVQDAVRKLPGIKKVKANKQKKEAVIDYEASLVTTEQIIEAINSTGYSVIL